MSLKRVNFSPLHTFTRASDKTAIDNASGLLVTVPANEPAFSWSSVFGGRKPLTIHEARTNYLFSSADFTVISASGWIKTAGLTTVAADSIIEGESAVKVTNDGLASAQLFAQNRTVTGTAATAYVIVEKSPSDTALTTRVSIFDSTAGFAERAQVIFNWSTEAVSSSAGTAKATKLVDVGPNGGKVFLVECTSTSIVSGNTHQTAIYPTGSTLNSNSITLHFAQLENGAFATPPIITAGTSATRAADVCTIGDLSGWFNPSEGTFVVELIPQTNSVLQRVLSLNDGTTGNTFNLYLFPSVSNLILSATNTSGGSLAVSNISNVVFGGKNKVAISVTPLEVKASVNGGTVLTFTLTGGASIPTSSFNRLDIGNRLGINVFNGSLNFIDYKDFAATDAQLQEWSTL